MLGKIFLYSHGGSFNHGNEAIVRGTAEILKEYGRPTLFSLRPGDEERFGITEKADVLPQNGYGKGLSGERVKALLRKYFYRDRESYIRILYGPILRFAEKGDIALSTGGDIYCYEDNGWLNDINHALVQKGVRPILWGCSIEPSLLNNTLLESLSKYERIICRESITFEALKKEFPHKTKLFPDPAFVLQPLETDKYQGIFSKETVGINASPLIQYRTGGDYLKNLLYLINHILDTTDYNIAFIPHVNGRSLPEKDCAFMQKYIIPEVKEKERIVLVGEELGCTQLKYIISQCAMMVASRTHASIAAYSACVPTIVTGYSVKSYGIARDIFGTAEHYVTGTKEWDREAQMADCFDWLNQNKNRIKKHLTDFMPGYIQRARDAGKEIGYLMAHG